jgi:hypothetical protein
MADAELEADRLATAEFAKARDEAHHIDRRRKRAVARRRKAILADCNASNRRDFGADLGAGQHAAMAGLGALPRSFSFPTRECRSTSRRSPLITKSGVLTR